MRTAEPKVGKSIWLFAAIVVIAALVFLFHGTRAGSRVVIKGSSSILPLAQRVAEAFQKTGTDVAISISGAGSRNGVKAIMDGTCDIAMLSRALTSKEEDLAVERNVRLVVHRVAMDSVVSIVHPDNPVEDLDILALRAVYRGERLRWKSVGGLDNAIAVAGRDSSSGTYDVWREVVLDGQNQFPGTVVLASNGAMVDFVAKNPFALGYVSLGYVNDSVKSLSVGGVEASEDNVLGGEYPISRTLLMLTVESPPEPVRKYLQFLESPRGGEMIREEGYIPLAAGGSRPLQ